MPRKKRKWRAPESEGAIKKLWRRIEVTLDYQVNHESDVAEREWLAAQESIDHEAVATWFGENYEKGYEGRKAAALAAARQGDTGPVEELLSELERRHIGPKKVGPGRGKYERKKFEPPPTDLGTQLYRLAWPERVSEMDRRLRLHAARADLKRVRDLRQKHLDGKRKDEIAKGLTAEKIVAERWGLTEGEVKKNRLAVGRS